MLVGAVAVAVDAVRAARRPGAQLRRRRRASAGSFGVPMIFSASGSTVSPRRSVVPASSIASTSSGSVILCPPFGAARAGGRAAASGTTELNSSRRRPRSRGACLLFQLVMYVLVDDLRVLRAGV